MPECTATYRREVVSITLIHCWVKKAIGCCESTQENAFLCCTVAKKMVPVVCARFPRFNVEEGLIEQHGGGQKRIESVDCRSRQLQVRRRGVGSVLDQAGSGSASSVPTAALRKTSTTHHGTKTITLRRKKTQDLKVVMK